MIAPRASSASSGCSEVPFPAGLRWTATLLFPPGGPRRFPRRRAPGVLRLAGRAPIARERRGMTAPRSGVANGRREWRDAREEPPDPATGRHRGGARFRRRETSRTAAAGSGPAALPCAPRRLDDAEPDRSPKAAGAEAPDGARREKNLQVHRPVETLETDARPIGRTPRSPMAARRRTDGTALATRIRLRPERLTVLWRTLSPASAPPTSADRRSWRRRAMARSASRDDRTPRTVVLWRR